LEALAAGEKAGALDTARVEFQAALNLDPQNWLARFQLAVVLRKIGDSSAAIMHFEWFKKALASQTVPSLTHYLQSCPDFPYVVQYHLASAYAQSDGRNDLYTAEKMFGELMALPGTPAGTLLEAAHKLRHLEMLGRSGDTALQIALVYRNHNGGEANQKVQREVGSRIQEYVQWFDDRADELEHAWAADYMLARGLLLYAHGRMQYLRGDRRGAIKSLTEATALVPRFADVYVDLANTYLAIKSPHDWPQRVMVLLDRALAIDTSNPKARFAYARFYFTNVGRNLRKAEEYLRDLPPHPGSLFMYAQVMAAEDKYAEAIELLDRSIAMNKEGSSYRIRMYGECLWELAQGGASLKRLRQARRSFLEHMKLVKDADEVDRLTRLLNEINELIARLQGTPAALASPPSPEAPQGGPTPDEPVRHAQRRA
jgi:tetratricopeptide (TPR) repeat protein